MSQLETVRKLITLAGTEGTPLEEARTAGLLAARLIVKHKLVVGGGSSDLDQLLEVFAAEQSARKRAPYHAWTNPEGVQPAESTPEAQTSQRKVVTATIPGKCKGCGIHWSPGYRIAWSKERGAICLMCHKA
jgi:hypothetical protein